jgi:hypothetical protein
MRPLLFVAFVAIVGCGKKETSPSPASGVRAADPVVALREADEQAAFSIDAACAAIEDALAATKRLAPVAGGDAKEALLDVAEMLDSAGATLADHNEPPPPLDAYRKEEAERATERQKAVADALDALKELRDARGTLDDLAANVPSEHSKALDAIGAQNDEAIDAVESGITHLGGKVPTDEEAP